METEDTDDVADPCAECGGKCCSFRSLAISYHGLEAGERYDSMLLNADIGVDELVFTDGTVPDMEWYTIKHDDGERALAFDCNHAVDGKCTEYDRRPAMCRWFECPPLQGEEDLDDWLEAHARIDDPEDIIDREVTDRVQAIIERDATVPEEFAESGGN